MVTIGMIAVMPDWDGDIPAARALQVDLAQQLVLRDQFPQPLRTIAGFHVDFEDGGATTRAAAVLMDADTLDVIDQQVVRLTTRVPYIPDLLSFSELPALLAALALLPRAPDLAFINGHGIAHPHRLGIAAHFGVVANLPSIGVARDILIGESRTNLHDMRGAFTPLRDGDAQIGWVLRSKPGCQPLIISPGHRVAMASAPELVMRFVTRHRLPETTRLADQLAVSCDHTASASP